MGIGIDRPINIYFNQNRRGSLEKAQLSSEQMQAFINELDGAYRSNRFVVSDPTACHNRQERGLAKLER